MGQFSHLDEKGRASMVDVGAKTVTGRTAIARAMVYMQPTTLHALTDPEHPKGDVLQVARLAGIMAAKRTDELIPLCHSLGLDHVQVRFCVLSDGVLLETTASCQGKTGVEMEAMTAASIASLTIYDMVKGVDKQVWVGMVYLHKKTGGKSGTFVHPNPPLVLDDADLNWL